MAVSIRLRRMGRKKKPHYRVVIADTASPRDGRFVESIGYYRPLTAPARLVLDLDRVDYWISKGAIPSGTVRSLISKARAGGDAAVALGEVDRDTEKARKAEVLAAKRKAEADLVASAAAAAAEAAAKAAANKESAPAEAVEEPEAEAEVAVEEEPEAEAAVEENKEAPTEEKDG